MAVHIELDASALARSRFAVSPAAEIRGVLRSRSRHPHPHARRWFTRAANVLDRGTMELLLALHPDDHPYSPDFLLPQPRTSREDMVSVAQRIAETPPEIVDHHLDIALQGRPVRAEVAAGFPSRAAYEAWRRVAPEPLARLIRQGPRAVAQRSAEASLAFFDAALAEDWRAVLSVLEADIAYRGGLMATRGAAALLGDLGPGVTWTGAAIRLDRPFDHVVDWGADGIVLLPSTTHTGPVTFAAEEPLPPLLTYAARGVAGLWQPAADRPGGSTSALAELIGGTRLEILRRLDEPRSTRELSLSGRWTAATVSYHLGILQRTRMVTRTRRGRHVLYARTDLAEAVLGTDRS